MLPAELQAVPEETAVVCGGLCPTIEDWATQYLDTGQAALEWAERLAKRKREYREWAESPLGA
jgi:hypothetical protein